MKLFNQSKLILIAFIGVLCMGALTKPSQNMMPKFYAGSSYIDTTANCLWSRTNTALGAFTADTDCPGNTIVSEQIGDWLTTDSDLPQQTINDLPAGNYEVTVSLASGASASAATAFTISDGSTTSGRGYGAYETTGTTGTTIVGMFTYASAGNRTFAVHGSATSGDVTISNATGNRRIEFRIVRLP